MRPRSTGLAALSATLLVMAVTAAPAGASVILATPSVSATENVALTNVVVDTFTSDDIGANPGAYTPVIAWGDGSTSSGTVSESGATFSVTGSPTYAEGGRYAITVTVGDTLDPSHPGAAEGTATVADAPLSASGPPALSLAEGGSLAGVTLAHFTDSDTGPTPPASAYTATVAWGDGATSSATVSGTPTPRKATTRSS